MCSYLQQRILEIASDCTRKTSGLGCKGVGSVARWDIHWRALCYTFTINQQLEPCYL